MGMGGMIDFLFLASGIYLIYTAIMAKKQGAIADSVMLGKNTNEKDIKDKLGFIEYMYKRIMLAGVLISIAATIHLVNDYYIGSKELTWVGIALIFIALVVYTMAYMRGQKRYMTKKK